ncbi:MAG: N-acyl-D-amino-acid deacylase family protein [Pseudomonadales bacterium]
MTAAIWDTLISEALVFDGSGGEPQHIDIALKDGKIVAKGLSLPREQATEVINGEGQWLMPGLLDIHTHLDLEVDLDPRLPEVVRHGTTTVLVGNCSLGTCFGKQIEGEQNPIVDCFTRVENIPKAVLAKCVDAITWDSTADYMEHFAHLPLGPNVAAFVPHSMLRVEVMGLEASVTRKPTDTELEKMAGLLDQALDEGYMGMSTDGLPFHYMANDPNTDKRIPTQFAPRGEMKRLLQVVRDRNRVWQTTPIIENRLKAFLYFAFTSGRLFGKTLKTSALSVMEFALMPKASNMFLGFAKLINSSLFKGNMHFQALGTNFRVWSDGIVSPLYEEMESTCKLIAKEYDDVEGRRELLNDPAFIDEFRRDWAHGRSGWNLSHLKTKLGVPDNLVMRDFDCMIFDGAPIPEWERENFQQVFDRLQAYQNGAAANARSDAEKEVFDKFPKPIGDDAEFMLHMLREYDKNFRFWIDIGNVGNKATLGLLLHENTMPGFNDSGAHITNMAFFDANLMSLKLANDQSQATVSKVVQRLTSEPAKFFGLDVGTLDIGAQADITMINPKALAQHDCDPQRKLEYRELIEHQQMVNRSDGVVSRVLINGESVWIGNEFAPVLGSKTLGRALRAS